MGDWIGFRIDGSRERLDLGGGMAPAADVNRDGDVDLLFAFGADPGGRDAALPERRRRGFLGRDGRVLAGRPRPGRLQRRSLEPRPLARVARRSVERVRPLGGCSSLEARRHDCTFRIRFARKPQN